MRIALFFLVLLVAVCGGARAQSQAVTVAYGTAGGTLTGGAITTAAPSDFTRLIQGGTVLGDVSIRDGAKARVGAVDVNMVLDRRMPWQQVARGAAAIGRTIPYVATAVAFIDLMDTLRLRSDGQEWKQDPGTPQVNEQRHCISSGQNPAGKWCAPSSMGAHEAYLSALNVHLAALACGGGGTGCNRARIASCTLPSCNYERSSGFSTGVFGPWTAAGTQTSALETVLTCPASVDALNPANSIPAGLPVGYDGKCRTGRYTEPKTETVAGDIAVANGAKAAAVAAVGSMLGRSVDLAPRTDTPAASGPGTVAQPGTTTTTTGPSGTTTGTSTPTAIVVYNGPSYTWNDSTVVTTTNGGGTTTTTTNSPPAPQVETCGLPGKPACKIDETGTPSVIPPFSTTPIDATKTTDAAKQDTEIGRVINPGFGWFTVPPMATCAPIAWPGGVQINPCNGIEVVRSIMAYLWALYGAVWSFGVFRRSLPGAA